MTTTTVAHWARIPDVPLRLGISACLLGQKVRFDGGHKRSEFLADMLARYVEWVPVCPEVELGLGTPRETLRLEEVEGRVRMLFTKSRADLSDRMRDYARDRLDQLADLGLSGYVLKKDSPSCGMERVRVHEPNGQVMRRGRGVFAAELMTRMPDLPVEEEGRLSDARLRENFIERVFAYTRLGQLFGEGWRLADLVAFHTAHKLTLMAHSPQAYQTLGRVVAAAKGARRAALERDYRHAFMQALARPASRGRHANVLLHVAGYFKTQLEPFAKTELLGLIDDYRQGLVPRVVPLTLLRHYVGRFDVEYLRTQAYLQPHAKELMLQTHT